MSLAVEMAISRIVLCVTWIKSRTIFKLANNYRQFMQETVSLAATIVNKFVARHRAKDTLQTWLKEDIETLDKLVYWFYNQ